MPNASSYYRTSRYSRPPSLSTIGSNEEADFSTSRRNRQTFQSTYSVSPLEQGFTYQDQHSAAPAQESYSQKADNRRSSFYVPAQPRNAFLSQQQHNSVHSNPPQPDFRHSSMEPQKPALSRARPLSFILPIMDSRPNTAGSDTTMVNTKYMKTRYMWMLLQADQIPWWHNFLAAIAAWIVLAAYLIVPGTFTSFKNNPDYNTKSAGDTSKEQLDHFANQIVGSVDNLGLLVFSGILAGSGGFVCVFLYFMHWQNYFWLSMKIFQPMMFNAFAGLLTTIVNVYTAQKGVWSRTAQINASVTGAVAGVAGGLFLLYNFWLLDDVKKDHRKHFPQDAELVDPMRQTRFHQKVGRFLPNQKGY